MEGACALDNNFDWYHKKDEVSEISCMIRTSDFGLHNSPLRKYKTRKPVAGRNSNNAANSTIGLCVVWDNLLAKELLQSKKKGDAMDSSKVLFSRLDSEGNILDVKSSARL